MVISLARQNVVTFLSISIIAESKSFSQTTLGHMWVRLRLAAGC
jgi:hypothetical protein